MHRIIPRRFTYVIFSVAVFSVPAVLFAQNVPTGSFVVSPAKEEIALDPGGVRSLPFTLENGTAYPIHVDVSFEDVAPAAQSSAIDEPVKMLGNASGVNSLKDLLSLSKKSYDIPVGGSAALAVGLTVPKKTPAGGRYGSVVFTFRPITEGNANIAVESRIAALVYLRVNGESHEEGALLAFGLFNDAKMHAEPSQADPLRFQVAYENTGDVYLDPYGMITVKGLWGKPTTTLIDPWAVLPGATRMREVDLFGPLSPGVYSARVDLNRGYGDIVDSKEVTFYVLPTPLRSLMILLGLIVAVILLRRSLQLSRHML